MIILHIAVALASIVLTSLAYFALSRRALTGAYITAGATLATGIALVVISPSTMLHVCMAGIAYLAVVSLGIVLARGRIRRLATEIVRK
jgi:ABC-type Fe3+-siderophore transport system permease subunit